MVVVVALACSMGSGHRQAPIENTYLIRNQAKTSPGIILCSKGRADRSRKAEGVVLAPNQVGIFSSVTDAVLRVFWLLFVGIKSSIGTRLRGVSKKHRRKEDAADTAIVVLDPGSGRG